jgi:hypothetical protein
VSSEARGKSCGLKMLLSQGKRPVARKPLAAILACCSSLVCIAELFANLVDGDDPPAVDLNGAIFQFLGSRMFSGAP